VARLAPLLGFLITLSSCAGSSPEASAPDNPGPSTSPEAEASPATAEPLAKKVDEEKPAEPILVAAMPPNECRAEGACLPPQEFARAVCKGRFPGLAISLFEKNTPWERRYVKVESIEPVNTHGGATTSERLAFTEEVLLLRHQSANADGIQVSGASDVDVLRWDGTCVTVREEYLSIHRMPTVGNATVNWRYLDEETQKGLLEAKYVNVRYQQQREACRRSSASNLGDACAKATSKLNDAITVAVRGGLELPEPGALPIWKPAGNDDSSTRPVATR
jgi:hypothetical protein